MMTEKHITQKKLKNFEDIKEYIEHILWSSNYADTKRERCKSFLDALKKIRDLDLKIEGLK